LTSTDLDTVVEALADLRARVVPLILARQERRRDGATAGERLTTSQHITLLCLADGPLAVSEVAAATGVAVSTATRMVQSLERAGWVERTARVAGDDRRRRPVALTDEGQAVAEEAGEVVRARLRGLAERLDDDGRRAVLEGLAAFALALQEDEAAAAAGSANARSAASISPSEGAGGASGVAPSGRIPSRMTPR
jgi:DNA-binding MarR family transcriptional regulator